MPKFKKSKGYKMRGFSGFKDSPINQKLSLKGTGGSITYKKDSDLSDFSRSMSFSPGIRFGNLSLNTNLSIGGTGTKKTTKKELEAHRSGETTDIGQTYKSGSSSTKIGGALDYTFGGKDRAGFMGSINVGGGMKNTKQDETYNKPVYNVQTGHGYQAETTDLSTSKPYYGGRISAGVGKQSTSQKKCLSGSFGCTSQSSGADWNIMGFGEKSDQGTSVGLSGKYGVLSGEAKYNLQTEKPEFKFGVGVNF